MDHRMAIDLVDTGDNALPELLFGCYPDVTQDRTCKLGEEALDEIEPGTVNRREGEFEAAGRASGEPASGLLRDMSGVIVENQLDCRASGIGGVKELEEFNELAAAVAVPDQGVNLPGKQINPGQQAERTRSSSDPAACPQPVNADIRVECRRRRPGETLT